MPNLETTFVENLLQELKDASSGQSNSIKYLKSDLTRQALVEENENFQVIMVGGSHLESILARFENNQLEMLNFRETDIQKLATKEIFFEYIQEFLEPDVEVVALNFAYPIEPFVRDGRFDGKLVARPKGHNFEGLYQKNVGQELEEYFLQLGRKIKFTICNDTTALGLASLNWQDYKNSEKIMGVVGTGFNFGLFENEKTFVNLELGNFDKFEMTKTGRLVDNASDNKSLQKLEKEVGGGYIFQHFNYLVEDKKPSLKIKNTKQLSTLLAAQSFVYQEEGLQVYKNSSSFVAMTIFALYKFKQWQNQDENLKMLVLIEGSLYWKAYKFKEMVDQKLLDLGMNLDNLKIDQTRKIGLKGAANLVLAD
jgi:hexokinase